MPSAYNDQGLLKKNPLIGTTLINPASIDGQNFMRFFSRAIATQAYTRNEYQATLTAEYDEYKGPLATSIHGSRAAILRSQNRIAAANIQISELEILQSQHLSRAANRQAFKEQQLATWNHMNGRRQAQVDAINRDKKKAQTAAAGVGSDIKKVEEEVKTPEFENITLESQLESRAQSKLDDKAREYEIFFGGGGGTRLFSPNVAQESDEI